MTRVPPWYIGVYHGGTVVRKRDDAFRLGIFRAARCPSSCPRRLLCRRALARSTPLAAEAHLRMRLASLRSPRRCVARAPTFRRFQTLAAAGPPAARAPLSHARSGPQLKIASSHHRLRARPLSVSRARGVPAASTATERDRRRVPARTAPHRARGPGAVPRRRGAQRASEASAVRAHTSVRA